MSGSDDSDDSDSDFEPDVAEVGVEETKESVKKREPARVTAERKRRVEEIWETMKAEEEKQMQAKKQALGRPTKKRPRESSMNGSKVERVLVEIFGRTVTASMLGLDSSSIATASSPMHGQPLDAEGDSEGPLRKRLKTSAQPSSSAGGVPLPATVGGAVAGGGVKRGQPAKVTVTEKVKYAGKEIEVTRTLAAGETAAPEVKAKKGIDQLLGEMKGVKAINTVDKSSYDWDTFKNEKGLEDELKQATKDGFLHKKDFLERCDVRQFEQERDARNARRATAAAAAASTGGPG